MPPIIPKYSKSKARKCKPFLKWAGGKTQLIPYIKDAIPEEIVNGASFDYVEPFVGSGAVLFWMLTSFPNLERAIINDINSDLTIAYTVVKNHPHELIDELLEVESDFYSYDNHDEKKAFFLEKRQAFNARDKSDIINTALLIFLNKTCFNGLYRVNKKNGFNVPFGRHKKIRICHKELILANSKVLQKVIILNNDYAETKKYLNNKKSFFYFDPPYKPISKTAKFNHYSQDIFNDKEQVRLKQFCDALHLNDHKWILSNSDPKNVDSENNFFDDLYRGYKISRVEAIRKINSNRNKRGKIFEILIQNY